MKFDINEGVVTKVYIEEGDISEDILKILKPMGDFWCLISRTGKTGCGGGRGFCPGISGKALEILCSIG